jgi:hypothetical protein
LDVEIVEIVEIEKIFDEKVEIEKTQLFLTAKMQKCRSCSLTAFQELLRDCQMNVFSSPE